MLQPITAVTLADQYVYNILLPEQRSELPKLELGSGYVTVELLSVEL